ncbi:DsbE family thiol:disulfide interchange protein [Beijerinckia indica]|uniref:Periplasmic protein thiol--disulphide oxidoreductase DsbE n=1 Tax=Beijerinckia indica subsp. indica (strain ATCC 9039 / DSM 1715 / NCIMB 8712) TaxID=395963 RepID=B2IGH7_BEII9|nr:DsbE family thiol:disulfide interchange protein [Beijerinckia indica]ACB94359.1 periplasmic protein thiol--disulphide oxidoreductase DsbE [Beijerinckia indica subsp. indica ATCC 9039]
MSEAPQKSPGPANRRSWLIFAPLLLFLAIAGLFLVRLFAGDASLLPSALIDRPTPTFALSPVEGLQDVTGLSNQDLAQGHVSVVNFFASWCVPCHQEHGVLMQLAADPTLQRAGLRLYGIAYKDKPENIRQFLNQRGGNPYAAIGNDAKGRVGIDWGLYGVPETYVVRGDGTIAYKFIGPLSDESLRETLVPEIKKADLGHHQF